MPVWQVPHPNRKHRWVEQQETPTLYVSTGFFFPTQKGEKVWKNNEKGNITSSGGKLCMNEKEYFYFWHVDSLFIFKKYDHV